MKRVVAAWLLICGVACAHVGPPTPAAAPPAPTPLATPTPAPPPDAPPPDAPPPGAIGAVRPWIGVSLADGTRGVRIKAAIDQTPGARAGLQPDDEILAIDGAAVRQPRDVIDRVGAKGVGTRVTLHILRNARELDVQLALEARPDAVEILHRKILDKPAPWFTLTDAIGPHPASLQDLAGNVVVVEFGATWCRFCMSTIPRLEAWQAKYRAQGLRVLWISSEPFETIHTLDPGDRLTFTRARDEDDKVAAQYFVQALPTLVVIDRAGIVRAAEMGAGDTVDAIEATFVKQLAQPAPPIDFTSKPAPPKR